MKLCALPLEVGLIELVPRPPFFDECALKIETVGAPFIHSNVRDPHVLLRDRELQFFNGEIGRRLMRRRAKASRCAPSCSSRLRLNTHPKFSNTKAAWKPSVMAVALRRIGCR